MKRLSEFLIRLPGLKQMSSVVFSLQNLQELRFLQRDLLRAQLLNHSKHSDPKRLNRFELECMSQSGEDGILAEIFHRIGTKSKVFAEFGVEDGLQTNTGYLLLQGWTGFWFEGDAEKLAKLQKHANKFIGANRLLAAREFFTAENAAKVFEHWNVPRDLDLLSIDIDRNTSFVWRSLSQWQPRVAVVEYNATFAPTDSWEVDYQPALSWNGTMYYGASLRKLEEIGRELGYCLVGCNLAGVNAFFVRADLVGDHFCAPFTAENHFEPARHAMCSKPSYPPCLGDC